MWSYRQYVLSFVLAKYFARRRFRGKGLLYRPFVQPGQYIRQLTCFYTEYQNPFNGSKPIKLPTRLHWRLRSSGIFDFLKHPSLQNKLIFQSFDENDENDKDIPDRLYQSNKSFVRVTHPDGIGLSKPITTKLARAKHSIRASTQPARAKHLIRASTIFARAKHPIRASTQPARAKHLIRASITTPRTTDIQGVDKDTLSNDFNTTKDEFSKVKNSFGTIIILRRKPAFLISNTNLFRVRRATSETHVQNNNDASSAVKSTQSIPHLCKSSSLQKKHFEHWRITFNIISISRI